MLTPEQLQFLEGRLNAEKNRLQDQIKELDVNVDFGSDIDHLEEEADETEEIANVLGIRNALQKQLDVIATAIKKITEKKYGACEQCGKEIDFELLKINPESKLCRICKKGSK